MVEIKNLSRLIQSVYLGKLTYSNKSHTIQGNLFLRSQAGIYPSNFTNTRFLKNIEFSSGLIREKRLTKLSYNEDGGLVVL